MLPEVIKGDVEVPEEEATSVDVEAVDEDIKASKAIKADGK